MTDEKRPELPATSSPDLAFPELPRLRVEAVVGDLTERAGELLATQRRMRTLLRAHAAVARDLSLPVVLDHIVCEARQLVGARYAALGVLGDAGELVDFRQVGVPAEDVARIGRLPRGRGVIGWIINNPEPVRIDSIADHPAAAGFPPGHPTMTNLLSVPVTAGGRVFGNLYLADAAAGAFTEDDEHLVVALAASAGIAIGNARLYDDAQRRHRWQVAATEVSQQLFLEAPDDPWPVVLKHALTAGAGDGVLAAVPHRDEPAALSVVATAGCASDPLAGTTLRLGPAMAQALLHEAKPALLTDETRALSDEQPLPGVASLVLAPVMQGDRVAVVLGVARTGGVPLGLEDAEQVARFAGHVTIAVELAAARADRERVRLLEDHERIAADLNDGVVGDLFAAGMTLEALVPFLSESDRARVTEAVDAIDRSITRVRAAVFRPLPKRRGG